MTTLVAGNPRHEVGVQDAQARFRYLIEHGTREQRHRARGEHLARGPGARLRHVAHRGEPGPVPDRADSTTRQGARDRSPAESRDGAKACRISENGRKAAGKK